MRESKSANIAYLWHTAAHEPQEMAQKRKYDIGNARGLGRACLRLAAVTLILFVALLQLPRLHEQEYAYLLKLVRKCGPLCSLDQGEFTSSLFFDHRSVPVSCEDIFSSSAFIQHGHGHAAAPRYIPDELLKEFTMNGRITVTDRYFDQMYLTKTALTSVWSKTLIEDFIRLARNSQLNGTYSVTETNHLRSALAKVPQLIGGRVLVIGSELPWVEACVLEARAREIVTVEYGAVHSEHPQVSTKTPKEFRDDYLSGTLGNFDVVVTFSSVEHSGLGRYGDALNPWGDVLEIARAHCVTKLGGALVLAVMNGDDKIEFNAHRVYGDIRWPYLVTNWRQMRREPSGGQVVYTFIKYKE